MAGSAAGYAERVGRNLEMETAESRRVHNEIGQGRFTRRGMLRGAVGMGGALAAMTLAGACGPGAPTPAPVAPAAAAPTPTAPPAPAPPAATTAPPAAAANTPAPAPTAAAAAPAAAGQPKRGGVLISALTADPVTLDPHLGFPGSPQALMYETLTYFDAQSKVQPLLAESWEVLDEGATIVFRLRKGVKFHSGREMVADDVKYSMERLQDKASVFAADYAVIQKIDIVDPYTVKMSFAKPFPGVFRMLSQFKGGEIVGKEGVQKWGDLARNGMGTGPFMLDRWTSGSEIVLKRHPDYWRKELPYMDGITFKIIKDEDAIVAGLRRGS